MARSQNLFTCIIFTTLFVIAMSERITADGNIDSNWYDATFYGDMTGSENMRKYNYIVIAMDGGTIEFCLNLISENKKSQRFLVSFTTT